MRPWTLRWWHVACWATGLWLAWAVPSVVTAHLQNMRQDRQALREAFRRETLLNQELDQTVTECVVAIVQERAWIECMGECAPWCAGCLE